MLPPDNRCFRHPGAERHEDVPAGALVPGGYYRTARNPVAYTSTRDDHDGKTIGEIAAELARTQAALAVAEIACSMLPPGEASELLDSAVRALHRATEINAKTMPEAYAVFHQPEYLLNPGDILPELPPHTGDE